MSTKLSPETHLASDVLRRNEIEAILTKPDIDKLLQRIEDKPEEILDILKYEAQGLSIEEKAGLIIEAISLIRELISDEDNEKSVSLIRALEKIDPEATRRGIVSGESYYISENPEYGSRESYKKLFKDIYGFEPDNQLLLDIKKSAIVWMLLQDTKGIIDARICFNKWELQPNETEILDDVRAELRQMAEEGDRDFYMKKLAKLERDWKKSGEIREESPMERTMPSSYTQVLRELRRLSNPW